MVPSMRTDDKQVKPVVLGQVISLAVPSGEVFLKPEMSGLLSTVNHIDRPQLRYLPEANGRSEDAPRLVET